MSRPPCHHCAQPARYRVTGANLRDPVDVCDGHLAAAQKTAGIPRTTVQITDQDDRQEALFEVPEQQTKGRNRR